MHLAGGLGSLLEIRCSRTPIIMNIIGENDSSNGIHLKRFDPLMLPAAEIQSSQIR